MICYKRKFKNVNMPLPTILILSMKITSSFLICVLIVLSLSLSSVQYSKPRLAGILKAECRVLPLILNAAFPVGTTFSTLMSSGFSPYTLFKYLIKASYKALVTVVLPTPAPPLKKSASASSRLVLMEFRTW